MNVNVCMMRVRVLHLYLNYTICLRSSVNDNTCLLGDAILRIPRVSPRSSDTRDMRVSAHIARGIRMMASFRRLQKGSHLSTPVYLAQRLHRAEQNQSNPPVFKSAFGHFSTATNFRRPFTPSSHVIQLSFFQLRCG